MDTTLHQSVGTFGSPDPLLAFLSWSSRPDRDGVMRRLLVIGAGTAGTMIVNKLRRHLSDQDWSITVVDLDDYHRYQPGYLFLPFGGYRAEQVTRSRHAFIPDGVDLVMGEVSRVDPESRVVVLSDGRRLSYDYLVIASGVTPRPDQTPGMLGSQWRRSVFDFYTYEGSLALAEALRRFTDGRLVVQITEMPIKCPVAPLEFASWPTRTSAGSDCARTST
jgi:sulfide:quinone oxidoreductase